MFFIEITSRVNAFIKQIQNNILPKICSFCGSHTEQAYSLCSYCEQNLPSLPDHCPRCAQFLPATQSNLACGRCLKNPPPFEQTWVLFPYQPPIIHLIAQLKFHQQLPYANLLGGLFSKKIRQIGYTKQPLPEIILPVPLHRLRLQERGFNQAVEIARPIAKALRIPIDIHSTERIKHTRPQSTLPAAERRPNVHEAFKVNKNFSGEHIAVIDDVMTTGLTLIELCKTLKKSGAGKIDVWCCARRDHHRDIAEQAKTR